jgi:agmatinase
MTLAMDNAEAVPLSMQPVPSFFGAAIGDIEDLSEGQVAVTGIYCDHFCDGEPGARFAARQLRYASWPALAHEPNPHPSEMTIDVGDLNVFPTEPAKTLSILKEQSQRIHQTGAKLLALGGDYSVTPALVLGQLQAMQDGQDDGQYSRLQIIRISRRLDAATIPDPHKTPLARACATRQLGEYCGGASSITLLGVSDVTALEEYDYFSDAPVRSARQLTVEPDKLVDDIVAGLPHPNVTFYLSVDIDVLASPLIRTNSPYLGTGLTPEQLITLIAALGKLPITGADVTGFIPDLDVSGSSASATVARISRCVLEAMSGEDSRCL